MIRKRQLERQCFIAARARAFVLSSAQLTGEEMAEILAGHAKKIGRLARNTRPPFIFGMNKSKITQLPLRGT